MTKAHQWSTRRSATGLAVCYDLRFQELFRANSLEGVELLALPAAFTAITTGRAHWEMLAGTGYREPLYVAAAARGCDHLSGRETHGHSMIINPWGTVFDGRHPRARGGVREHRPERLGAGSPQHPASPSGMPCEYSAMTNLATTNLDIARQRLLAPAGGRTGARPGVRQVLGHAVDSGDIYFQSTRYESWLLEDGIVKEGTHSIEQGAGVRAISGDKTAWPIRTR